MRKWFKARLINLLQVLFLGVCYPIAFVFVVTKAFLEQKEEAGIHGCTLKRLPSCRLEHTPGVLTNESGERMKKYMGYFPAWGEICGRETQFRYNLHQDPDSEISYRNALTPLSFDEEAQVQREASLIADAFWEDESSL